MESSTLEKKFRDFSRNQQLWMETKRVALKGPREYVDMIFSSLEALHVHDHFRGQLSLKRRPSSMGEDRAEL